MRARFSEGRFEIDLQLRLDGGGAAILTLSNAVLRQMLDEAAAARLAGGDRSN